MNTLGFYCALMLLIGAQDADDTIVAKVNHEPVYLSEILSTDEAILQSVKMARLTGHEVSEFPPDSVQLEEMRMERAIGALASRIEQIMYLQRLVEYGVSAGQDEIASKRAEMYEGMDPDTLPRYIQAVHSALNEALTAVYESDTDPDSAYQRYLKGTMSYRSWELQLISYEDPKRRALLRRALEENGFVTSDFDAGVRSLIWQQKMDAIIDEKIAERNEDYRRFVEHREKGRWPKEYSAYYDHLMRKQWWQDQYRNADIQILDERFKGAMGILLGSSEDELEGSE